MFICGQFPISSVEPIPMFAVPKIWNDLFLEQSVTGRVRFDSMGKDDNIKIIEIASAVRQIPMKESILCSGFISLQIFEIAFPANGVVSISTMSSTASWGLHRSLCKHLFSVATHSSSTNCQNPLLIWWACHGNALPISRMNNPLFHTSPTDCPQYRPEKSKNRDFC